MFVRMETVERNAMLRTKAMRERDEQRERRKYNYTLLRVRFPDGTILQGLYLLFWVLINAGVNSNTTNCKSLKSIRSRKGSPIQLQKRFSFYKTTLCVHKHLQKSSRLQSVKTCDEMSLKVVVFIFFFCLDAAGTFLAREPVTALYEFVRESLVDGWQPFELMAPGGQKLKDDQTLLNECSLVSIDKPL